jgi:transcriptional regulator with XRE-family HTH domain
MKVLKQHEEIFLKKLGARIAEIRQGKGRTQVDLGHKCDMEKANLRRIEIGNTNPTTLILLKICQALEISMSDLFNDL